MTLLEHRSQEEIDHHLAAHGLALRPSPSPPPPPDRTVSARARRAFVDHPHWADLVALRTGEAVHRWYGGGATPEAAVRGAAARWRVEQATVGST